MGRYGVASISRLLKILGLFCRICSFLHGSFGKKTYNFKEPTNRSRPIALQNCDRALLFCVQIAILLKLINSPSSLLNLLGRLTIESSVAVHMYKNRPFIFPRDCSQQKAQQLIMERNNNRKLDCSRHVQTYFVARLLTIESSIANNKKQKQQKARLLNMCIRIFSREIANNRKLDSYQQKAITIGRSIAVDVYKHVYDCEIKGLFCKRDL